MTNWRQYWPVSTRGFSALLCGNGTVGSGEQCDDGNDIGGDCCDGNCRHEAAGAPCHDGLFCNGADTCSGGTCPQHAGDPCAGGSECADACDEAADNCFDPLGTPCSTDGNLCTDDVCDGAGTCGVDNSASCDDGSLCTRDSCNPTSGCVNAPNPASGCNATAAKAILDLKDDAADGKDRLQFKWMKGSAAMAEFGAPTATTGYELCVYDGTGELVASAGVEGAADCAGTPCWSLLGLSGAENGVRYRDRQKPAAHDGVKTIHGRSGLSGKARLQIKADGVNVPPLHLGAGLSYPVTAQVVTDDATCFEATFTAGDEKRNDGERFKAMHDGP